MTTVATYASYQQPEGHSDHKLAEQVGHLLGSKGFDIVFGGGRTGPMGAIACAAEQHKVKITAVTLPIWMEPDGGDERWSGGLVTCPGLTHRLLVMEEQADAFLVLPGGRGTVVELYSAVAGAAMGLHNKPIVVLDPLGLFRPLWGMDDKLCALGYAKPLTWPQAPALVKTPQEAIDVLVKWRG